MIDLGKCTWCLRTPQERVTIIPTLRSSFIHKEVLTGDSLVIALCEHCIKMNKRLLRAYDVLVAVMNEVEDIEPTPPPENTWIDDLEDWMSTL